MGRPKTRISRGRPRVTVIMDARGCAPETVAHARASFESIGAKVIEGPIDACKKCGFFACVCVVRTRHKKDCKFRIAVECPVAIECEHGRDCCSTCDPCTCGVGVEARDFGKPS